MTQPKRWPNEALGVLEDVKALLLDIDGLARQTQEGARDPMQTLRLQSDVRVKARDAFHRLTLARAGQYQQENVQR